MTADRPERPTLLVVDDTATNLNLLAGLLHPTYRVKLAPSGPRALEIATQAPPDLILLDVMMPGLNGYQVCERLKAHPRTRDVPVVFVTAMHETEDEAHGFAVGAADYIHKPISPPILHARIRTLLEVKAAREAMQRRAAGLQHELEERMSQVERLRDATMFVMVSLAEFRDEDTGNHVKRTQEYVRTLAECMRTHAPDHPDVSALDSEAVDLLAKSAPLHDIGKVAIPDHILLKPGRLSVEEFEVMKTHTVHGWDLLNRAAQRMGGDSSFLDAALSIARHHHERWDGQGYPDGLAGRNIPFAARLMAVADVYDALISRRPYKPPLSHDAAMAHITGLSGQQFDPTCVDALVACQPRILDIANTWRD